MRYLFVILSLLSVICTSAQNITTTDLDTKDLQNVIAMSLNIEMQKYDLSEYLSDRYNVILYIDEYTRTPDSLIKKRINKLFMGPNRQFIEDATDREYFKTKNHFNKESNELTSIETITLSAQIESDTTAKLSFSIMPNGFGGSLLLDVITLDESYEKSPQYSSRPFKFKSDTNSNQETPLLLSGSFYYDKKHDVMRFCGEMEIDPELKAEIVDNIPHFYIIGVILKEAK